MSKMNEELQKALAKVVSQAMVARVSAKEAPLAAEEAQCAAEEAESLLRAAAILNKQQKSDILRHSVTLECDEPTLNWTPQSIEIDAEVELSDGSVTTVVTLSSYTVDLYSELDGLEPDSAEVELSVQHLVEGISETIMDYANGDDETEAAITAIANELRERLLDY